MYWGPTDAVWAVYIYWAACVTEILLACICASAPALKVRVCKTCSLFNANSAQFYLNRYLEDNSASVPDEKRAQFVKRGSVQRLLSVSGSTGDDSPPSSPCRPDFRCLSSVTMPSQSYSGKHKGVFVEETEPDRDRQRSVVENMQILNVEQLIKEGIVASKFEHVHPLQIGSAPQWIASWD